MLYGIKFVEIALEGRGVSGVTRFDFGDPPHEEISQRFGRSGIRSNLVQFLRHNFKGEGK